VKIYIAAPIFNDAQRAVVSQIKDEAEFYGHRTFSPYHNSRDIWRGRAPKDCSPEERAQVLSDNIVNIDWCNVLLAWVGGMGGYTDPGVVWEMGYAHKAEKFTLAYLDDSDERQSMNLMLAGTIDALVVGRYELQRALQLGSRKKIRAQFTTERLEQEREPIT